MAESTTNREENENPIVGILTQEVAYKLEQAYGKDKYTCYIAASYVKFIEGAGARVVPIWIGKDRNYYQNICRKVNGVLFPGGATYFNQSNGYADAGEHILDVVRNLNMAGDYFPLWGTCLGFELLAYLWLNPKTEKFRTECENFNRATLTSFAEGFRSSKMFKDAPEEVIKILETKNVAFSYHQFCMTDETFSENKLNEDWNILSHSEDNNNKKFISSMESKRFPFYGVQFHPEKCIYEWSPGKGIPHSSDAIKANRYFADFFVQECRKNHHKFNSSKEEEDYLIYKYPVTYTGCDVPQYQQSYLFS